MPRKRKAPSPTNAAENDNAASGTAAAAAAASKKKKESKEERRQRIAADTLKAKQWAQKRKMGKGTAAAAKGTVASSAKKAKEEKVQGKKKEEKVKEVKVKDDDKEVMSPGRKRGVTVKAKRTTPAKRAAATKSRVTSAKKTAASSNINGNDNDGDDVAIKGDTKTVTAAKEEEEDEKPKAKRARVEPAATGTDNATNTDASTTNSFQQHVATAPSPSVTGNHVMQYPPTSPFQQSAANHMQQHYNAMAQQQLLLQQQQQQQQRAAYLSSAMMNMQQYEYNQQPHRYNTNTSMSMPTPPPTPVVPAVPTSLGPPPPTTPSSTPQWQQQHQDMPPSVSVSVVQPPIPPPVSSSLPSLPKVSAPVTNNQKEEITTSPITKLQIPIKEDIKHHHPHPQLQPQLQPPQEEEEEEEEYENDNLQQSSSTLSKIVKSTKYMMILSINIIFLFFLFSYFFSSNSSSSSTIYNPSSRSSSSSSSSNRDQASNNPNNDMPCFKNYGFEKVYQKEIKKQSMNSSNNHEDVIIKTVKEHENYKPNCIHFNNKSTTKNIDYEILTCPKYGRCKNGQLIDCKGYTTTSSATDGDDDTNENDSLFYVPSTTNTYCDISNQSLNSIHELQNLIEQLTIQHVCYNNSCFSSIWNYFFAATSSTSTSTTTTSTNNENEEDGYLDLEDEDGVKTENYFKRFYQSLNKDQDRMIWKKNMKNSYINDYDDNDNDDGVIMFSINVLAKYINLKPNIVEDLIMFVQQEQNEFNNNNNNNEKNKSLSKLQIKTIVSPSTTSTTTTTSTWVGLSKQYIEQDLPIPTKCWIRLLFNDLLQSIFSLSIATIYFILNLGWSFILYTNPIYTIGTSLFLYIIVWARMKRNQISKLRLQVSHIQNLAYDKLILDSGGEGGEGYAVLHLRDDIVHELYPNIDDVRRKYFINTIWPKVITAVRMDNRVTKARKNLRGKSLEWWEWVADASRNSRINNSSSSKKMQ